MPISPRTKDMLVGGAIGAVGITILRALFRKHEIPFLSPGDHHEEHHGHHGENDRGEYGDDHEHHHKGHHRG